MNKYLIETERLYLHQFTLDDVQALLPILGDADVMQFSIDGPLTAEQIEHLLTTRYIKCYEEHGFGRMAVIDKSTNKLIGFCGISYQEIDGEQMLEIGYRFAKQYWGKGYATEAGLAVKEYARDVLKLPQFLAIIEPANTQSIRVAQKIGMSLWKPSMFHGKVVHLYRIVFE